MTMTRGNDSSANMPELLDRMTEDIIILRLLNVVNINQYFK